MALKGIFYPDVPFESLFIPWQLKEIYFDNIYRDIFNEHSKQDMVVLDIGANIGLVSHYLRKWAKIIYAIEPAQEHYEALTANVEFNQWKNVIPLKNAIADKDGEMFLSYNPQNRSMHSLVNQWGQGGEMIKCLSFETLLNTFQIDQVDFCKLDIEGYEEVVLMGDSFKKICSRVNSLIVEFHLPTFQNVINYMLMLGYIPKQIPTSPPHSLLILFTKR